MTRVLVVDDDGDTLYLLRALLQGHGYTVDAARHGAEALPLARQNRPDLVVSDLLMPVMDGYALLRQCKADEALRGVPFVVYTATYTDAKDERLARDLGADAFIVKPAEPDVLLQSLQRVLDAAARGQPAATQAVSITAEQAMEAYNAALVRKLEHKLRQLEQRLAERERAEEARREVEAQLRQVQKLQAVGTLAGGIAHDFNNIVGAILGHAALARQELPPDSPAQQSLAQIQAAGERARGVVQRILAFSRPSPAALANLPLQALIAETLGMLRATLPAIVAVDTRMPDEPLHALVDATQIEQVLLNLFTNAWHALCGSTGRIEVGVEAVDLDNRLALPRFELPPGRYVHLWVSDDGCGMDQPTQARIFEPFFTTKPVGEGTGLGLAVVHGIVSSHHGAINVESRLQLGSTFHVYLPRIEPAATSLAKAVAAHAPISGPQRHVLFVDDDDIISLLAERALGRAGCRVTCCTDGHQALAAVRAHPQAFDLVVTDYNMPGLSGLDLARELRALRPDLPVIVGSGCVDDRLRADAARVGVRELLNKERLAEDLLPLVRRALAANPARRGAAAKP